MIVASFWVIRDAEHPKAFDFPILLRILQTSCDRLGLNHVVLTDHATRESKRWPDGIEGWATYLPNPLMQAITTAQARFLEAQTGDDDILLCGADCILLGNPAPHYPATAGICITYRGIDSKYPINTGAVFVRGFAMDKVARLYRRVADRCQKYWCADQAELQNALRPLPVEFPVIVERRGIDVAFLPMRPFNVLPGTPDDPADGAVILHFRGKVKKQRMVDWAQKNGFA